MPARSRMALVSQSCSSKFSAKVVCSVKEDFSCAGKMATQKGTLCLCASFQHGPFFLLRGHPAGRALRILRDVSRHNKELVYRAGKHPATKKARPQSSKNGEEQ